MDNLVQGGSFRSSGWIVLFVFFSFFSFVSFRFLSLAAELLTELEVERQNPSN